MSFYFPEGSKFYFSKTLGVAKTVSTATNADPSVLTSTTHGLSDGQEVLFTSGWEDATDSVFKVDQLSADTFSLLGLNTTDSTFFPTGSGAGSVQVVSTWQEIPQLLNISTQGGDARFTSVGLMARRNDINVPTGFNPMSINLTLAHDPDNANYKTMLDVSRTLGKVAFKMVLSGGATAYGYGYLTVAEAPQLNRNQVNQVNASIGLLGRFISYGTA